MVDQRDLDARIQAYYVDAAAQERVASWIDTAPMPDGAVRSEQVPTGVEFFSYQGWTCEPMATQTTYWTVPGPSLVDAANWLLEHPVPGLVPTSDRPYGPDAEASDALTFGSIPELGSQEGIAFSVVKTTEGVAIRAEAGAIPASSVCLMPRPGESFGSRVKGDRRDEQPLSPAE